jgi:RNA polymerase sigma-70 factor, ECF subfamily
VTDSQPLAAPASAADDFAAVFREHYPYVVRLAAVMTGDVDTAKDVAQDVFIVVMKGLGAFRGESALRTWLYRITLRIAGRHAAKRRKHASPGFDFDALPGAETADSAVSLTELVKALGALSLESRAVLSLVAIEGLSHQAAADVLGVPVGTVWSRLHAARRQLAEAIGGS